MFPFFFFGALFSFAVVLCPPSVCLIDSIIDLVGQPLIPRNFVFPAILFFSHTSTQFVQALLMATYSNTGALDPHLSVAVELLLLMVVALVPVVIVVVVVVVVVMMVVVVGGVCVNFSSIAGALALLC